MNCQKLQETFDDRLDGRLGGARVKEFDAHVTGCADCRQQWQAYQALWDVVARQPGITPTFGFSERTLRRLRETAAAGRVWFWQLPVFRWATVGSLLLVIVVGAAVSWRQREVRREAEVKMYETVRQGSLEDLEVINALDKLQGDSSL